MRSQRLTSKGLRSLRPKTRTYTLWDTQLPALGVRVYSDGRCFYVTRLPSANKKIALVGQLSLKKARQHVQALIDSTREQENSKPVRLARFDAFVKEEWTVRGCPTWKPSSRQRARSALNRYLLPEFGRYPVSFIESHHVQRWFDALSRTYAGTANRNLDVLRSIFNYAVQRGYCQSNPCAGIKKNRKKRLNRFLSLEELGQVNHALTQVSQQGQLEACCCEVLRLLLLTGCRVSEVTGLKWSFVNGGEWHLPDSKTGPRVVCVGKKAQQRLSHISKQTWSQSHEPQGDVFTPLSRFVSKPDKVGMIWKQVRALANVEDVRIHDLRHTFASYAVLEGYPIPMVSKLLGHKRMSSTLRYAHVNDAQVTQSVEAIGEVIRGIVSEQNETPPKRRTVSESKPKKTTSSPKRRRRPVKAVPKPSEDILTNEQIQKLLHEVDFLDNF